MISFYFCCEVHPIIKNSAREDNTWCLYSVLTVFNFRWQFAHLNLEGILILISLELLYNFIGKIELFPIFQTFSYQRKEILIIIIIFTGFPLTHLHIFLIFFIFIYNTTINVIQLIFHIILLNLNVIGPVLLLFPVNEIWL